MAKLPHQSTVPPVDGKDAVNKDYGDSNYSGGGGGAAETFPILNTCMSFDGASNAQSTDSVFDLVNDFTLESWIKPNSDHDFSIISRHTGSWGNYTFFHNGGANLLYLWSLQGAGNQIETVTFDLTGLGLVNKWTHFAVTRDGTAGEVKFYLNGIQLGATQASATGALDTATTFELGVDGTGTRDLDGYQAEVRLWNVVRTADEIRANYTRALKGDETNLVAYYRDGFTDVVGSVVLTPSGGGAVAGAAGQAGTTIAHGLEHATGTISTDQGAVPAAGEALIADSPTSASWQPVTDSAAVHDNVAGEIAALTEKVAPVDGDHVLIEDSEDSNNKKRVAMSNMLGGSSGPIAAAQGDYLSKIFSGPQNGLATGGTLAFDTVDRQRGDLESSGNQWTNLKAGRTYLLIGRARSTTDSVAVTWWNDTASAYIGQAGSGPVFNCTNATEIITPDVDTTVEMRVNNIAASPGDFDGADTWAAVIEIGAVQADVVGGLEFMDRIVITGSAKQTRTFGSGGDGIYQRALDGDVDERYVLITDHINGAGGVSGVDVRPNGTVLDNTNAETQAFSINNGVISAGVQGANWYNVINSANEHCSSRIEINAKTGINRTILFQGQVSATGSTDNIFVHLMGMWSDTTTPITSLVLQGTAASAMGVGSVYTLYRMTSSNMRSDVAAVYERMAMETVDPNALATTERTVGHSIYGGSIVGISARVEDAVTAGDITVNVKVDGVTKLTAVLDTTNTTSKVERLPIGQAKFAADENISVEFVPSSYDNAGSSPSPVTVQVHMTNDALVTQNDRVVAKTVLSSDATTLSVTGLDGDNDGTYEIEGDLIIDTAAIVIEAQPNASTTDIFSVSALLDVTKTHLAGEWRILSQGAAVGTYHYIRFKMILFAARTKNGVARNRSYYCDGSEDFDFNATVHNNTFVSSGTLENQTDNLTSLDFVSSLASGIKAGSEIVVRRVKA